MSRGRGSPRKSGAGKRKRTEVAPNLRHGNKTFPGEQGRMHKEDLRTDGGWECVESEKWMAKPGLLPAQDRSLLIHVRASARPEGRSGLRSHPAAAAAAAAFPGTKPPRAPFAGRGPGSSLPGRQGAGPDHRVGAGAKTHARGCGRGCGGEQLLCSVRATQPFNGPRVEGSLGL